MFGQQQQHWIVLAVASGACAAFNGVFAKLTTTEMTSTIAGRLSTSLGLAKENHLVDYGLRAVFFGCNLIFNGIMWALFTTALARGSSTTRVSIINVSTNFMVTAVLGLLIFTEQLPPLWWLGASLLVAGNVIVGRRDDGEKPVDGAASDISIPSSPQEQQQRTRRPGAESRGAPAAERKSLLQVADEDDDSDREEEGIAEETELASNVWGEDRQSNNSIERDRA